MTLRELREQGQISKSSLKLCETQRLYTLKDLLHFFRRFRNFHFLPGCNGKHTGELINICKKYHSHDPSAHAISSLGEIIKRLSPRQKSYLELQFATLQNQLSKRSQTVLDLHIHPGWTLDDFVREVIDARDIDLLQLRNCGTKSQKELCTFIKDLDGVTRQTLEINSEEELNYACLELQLHISFGINRGRVREFLFPFIKNNTYPRWSLIDFLLRQGSFDHLSGEVLKRGMHILGHATPLDNTTLAEKLGKTTERIRQIRQSLLEELGPAIRRILAVLPRPLDDIEVLPYWVYSQDLFDEVSDQGDLRFTQPMTAFILSIAYESKVRLVGRPSDALIPRKTHNKNKYNWKGLYLLDKELEQAFDFNAIFYDLVQWLQKERTSTLHLDIRSLLYLHSSDTSLIAEIIPFIAAVAEEELGLQIDEDGIVELQRNTYKPIFEYAYEALEEIGQPAHVEDIYDRIVEMHPDFDKKIESVRSSLKREYGFIPFGRTSIFGLQKWNQTKEGIRGGTIREIAARYLQKQGAPIPIHTLGKYIRKYRPQASDKNILTNLKLDQSGEFVFFYQGFIGLSKDLQRPSYKGYENIPRSLGKTLSSYIRKGFTQSDDLVNAIVRQFDLPESAVRDIVDSQIERGLLIKDGNDHLYKGPSGSKKIGNDLFQNKKG